MRIACLDELPDTSMDSTVGLCRKQVLCASARNAQQRRLAPIDFNGWYVRNFGLPGLIADNGLSPRGELTLPSLPAKGRLRQPRYRSLTVLRNCSVYAN